MDILYFTRLRKLNEVKTLCSLKSFKKLRNNKTALIVPNRSIFESVSTDYTRTTKSISATSRNTTKKGENHMCSCHQIILTFTFF